MQSHAINVCLLSSWSTPCSVVLTVVMFEKKSPLKRLNIMFVTTYKGRAYENSGAFVLTQI